MGALIAGAGTTAYVGGVKLQLSASSPPMQPIIAVLDSNSDPSGITYPIPGNDDAIRAISLYCDMIAGAVFDGISAELQASGVDIGASEQAPAEVMPEAEDSAANA